MRVALALLSMVLLAACGSDDGDPTAMAASAPPGREYVLGFGETIHVGGMQLEFTTLAEDSRCPASVTCVWEGNARILLTASRGRATNVLELNTHAQFPTRVIFEGLLIELRRVEPYPATPALPAAQAYTVTLFIDVAPA